MPRSFSGLGLLVLLVVGCGGPRIVPVSGRVTLNGKPLANARVEFAPLVEGSKIVAPGSFGQTGADGAYSLKVAAVGTKQPGAAVGRHQVVIVAFEGPRPDPKNETPPERKQLAPPRYNSQTTLTFDVPPGGSSQADFQLTSP